MYTVWNLLIYFLDVQFLSSLTTSKSCVDFQPLGKQSCTWRWSREEKPRGVSEICLALTLRAQPRGSGPHLVNSWLTRPRLSELSQRCSTSKQDCLGNSRALHAEHRPYGSLATVSPLLPFVFSFFLPRIAKECISQPSNRNPLRSSEETENAQDGIRFPVWTKKMNAELGDCWRGFMRPSWHGSWC